MNFEKMKKIERHNEKKVHAVDMDEFIPIYGREVLNDKKIIEDLENKFKISKNQNPELNNQYEQTEKIEGLLPELMSDMLGMEGIESYKTSKYDDYKNGVDGYVVLDGLSSVFAYALDCTVTVDDNTLTLKNKVDKVKKNISEGHFTTIKYFKTNDFKGVMENIPRLIAPFKLKEVNQLENFKLNNNFNNPEFKKISLKFIWYLLNQLEVYMDYAENNGQDFLVEKYENIYEILTEIKDKKQGVMENDDIESVKRYIDNSPLESVLDDFLN